MLHAFIGNLTVAHIQLRNTGNLTSVAAASSLVAGLTLKLNARQLTGEFGIAFTPIPREAC